jgi:hypothetical protein
VTRVELEALAHVPRYSIVSAGTHWDIAIDTPESGSTRLLGNGHLRLSRPACDLVLAEIHEAIDAGWHAGLAQALLALEDQPDEAAALALRAQRRGTAAAAAPTDRATAVRGTRTSH